MSGTYSLACDQCRTYAWVGQRGASMKGIVYTGEPLLAKFMFNHLGHPLRFLSDHSWDEDTEEGRALLKYTEAKEHTDER